MIEANVGVYIHMFIMGGSLIFVFASALSACFYSIDRNEKEEDSSLELFIKSSFIAIVSIILFVVGNIKCEKSAWKYPDKPYSTEHIVSLNDSNMVNGKFYLRHGCIEENLYYQYMVKLNKGGFIANKVKADNAMLYYSDDNFRVEWYTKERHWLWFQQKETYNKIYIPEGSISEEYSIDLE